MPLIGVPSSISPELLYILAKMGHGDTLVIADANFPADSVAKYCTVKNSVFMAGETHLVLTDILRLLPLDQYELYSAKVMDRVQSDKDRNFQVAAYNSINEVISTVSTLPLWYVERYEFYEEAKKAYAVIQTNDYRPYANIIISKGVLVEY